MARESKKANVKQEFAAISGEVSKLRTDFRRIIRKLTSFGRKEAWIMKDNLMDRGQETLDKVEGKVRKKPLATVGYAFGIGMFVGLISRLFSRRRR